MLGKLLKYEIKATSSTFIFMYLAIIGLAIFNRLFNNFEFSWGSSITAIILVALFIALGVMTIIMAVQRFNKNLLGDEGYLMFTLPVGSKQIVFSKLIVTLMWTFFSGIVAIVTFLILFGNCIDWSIIKDLFTHSEWKSIDMELKANMQMGVWGFMISMIVAIIVSYIEFILMIYGALTVAQLPVLSKHRGLSAFGAFFIFNIVVNDIGISVLWNAINITSVSPKTIMLSSITFVAIISIGLFIGISVILNKHLNLE